MPAVYAVISIFDIYFDYNLWGVGRCRVPHEFPSRVYGRLTAPRRAHAHLLGRKRRSQEPRCMLNGNFCCHLPERTAYGDRPNAAILFRKGAK